MGSEEHRAEKLRRYLRELAPEARALLMAELERGVERGDRLPGADLILQELRNSSRGAAPPPSRIGDPVRLFFAPLTPFIVDDAPDYVHEGRLARASLSPLWQWISRDIAAAETKAYVDHAGRLLSVGDSVKAELAARTFQDRLILRIQETLAAARADDKVRRRLAMQIGTPRAIDDALRFVGLLTARDPLVKLAAKLPSSIRNLADDQLGSIKDLLDSVANEREVFTYGLVLVMGRLASPWQLIRLATRAAESDIAARVADTPYGIAVMMVLQEVERLVRQLSDDLKRGLALDHPTLLKDIHDTARGLRTEMDLSVDSPWARRLAAICGQIAEVLRSEIESVPGRVRRLLRPRPTREIVAGSAVDLTEVRETEALLAFVGSCRNYASELAINEMTLRAWSDVQHCLEVSVQTLVDGLRVAGDQERSYRQSQVDAAVRFCGRVFGDEYASLIAKAAGVAAQSERAAAAAAARA